MKAKLNNDVSVKRKAQPKKQLHKINSKMQDVPNDKNKT